MTIEVHHIFAVELAHVAVLPDDLVGDLRLLLLGPLEDARHLRAPGGQVERHLLPPERPFRLTVVHGERLSVLHLEEFAEILTAEALPRASYHGRRADIELGRAVPVAVIAAVSSAREPRRSFLRRSQEIRPRVGRFAALSCTSMSCCSSARRASRATSWPTAGAWAVVTEARAHESRHDCANLLKPLLDLRSQTLHRLSKQLGLRCSCAGRCRRCARAGS